jgi:hypothetical protein
MEFNKVYANQLSAAWGALATRWDGGVEKPLQNRAPAIDYYQHLGICQRFHARF